MLTMANRDHEVLTDEDHHLACFDDLAGQHHRFVRDVIDGLEHEKQRVVVSLQLGPLVGNHGVFDGQRVQPENVGHVLHLGLIGLVQADPDECARAPAIAISRTLLSAAAYVYLPDSRWPCDVDAAVNQRRRVTHGSSGALVLRRHECPQRFRQCV